MKNMSHHLISCIALFAIAIVVLTASDLIASDDRDEQEQVYRSQQSNSILSLRKILKVVRPHIKGEIIETEFEFEHGMPVYEIKYIDKSGRVREMYVDAKNGKIIKDELD